MAISDLAPVTSGGNTKIVQGRYGRGFPFKDASRDEVIRREDAGRCALADRSLPPLRRSSVQCAFTPPY